MKIERILFNSFFLIMMITTITGTSCAFVYLKGTIEKEINSDLERDASMLMEEIDMLIFERLQNIRSLAELDLLNEISTNKPENTDKLSDILSNFKSGYKGVYTNLHIVDANHKIIASSSAAAINSLYQPTDTYRPDFPNSDILLEAPDPASSPIKNKNLIFHVPLLKENNPFNTKHLYAEFNVLYLYRLLDKASTSGNGDRLLIIIDGASNLIASSFSDRQRLLSSSKYNFSDWRHSYDQSTYTRNGEPIINGQVVIGHANSEGYLGYAPLGWSILLIQSTEQAYFYLHSLWIIFITILFVTFLLAFATSNIISKSIARPLLALTHWVKINMSFMNPPQPFQGDSKAAEIHDLGVAFNQMMNELETSREHCIQASKLAVIGEMSAIMAHEVRTPLGILSSAAEYLQREVVLNPEDHEVTQIILDESIRLNKLVTSLLDCARPREPKMENHSLHDLLDNVISLLKTKADNKQHQFITHLLSFNPSIKGDADLLKQAFLNLLLNAIQITPEGGAIQISTRVTNGFVNIEIADNGPGINPDEVHRLFDPFYTKREGGIGLGLTVTQQIISAHEGNISAKNNQSGGACFTILLPLL